MLFMAMCCVSPASIGVVYQENGSPILSWVQNPVYNFHGSTVETCGTLSIHTGLESLLAEVYLGVN